MMRRKLFLFGDSITESSFDEGGWGAALANYYSRTADVVLRGYSGYNTRWARIVAERVFEGLSVGARPLAVTVFFGANDACLPDRSSAFQHVPLSEYQLNLRAIVSFLKERWPGVLVILITPPPIDEDGRLRHPYDDNPSGLPERSNEAAGAYAKSCVSVAMEMKAPAVDLWSKMQEFPGWEKVFLSDGLHLTREGNRIVYNDVVEILERHGLGSEVLPMDLPLFSEIDPIDPQQYFEQANNQVDG